MSKLYFVLMAAVSATCVFAGWDSLNGVGVYQLSLIWGGMVLGHTMTLALNETNDTNNEI